MEIIQNKINTKSVEGRALTFKLFGTSIFHKAHALSP